MSEFKGGLIRLEQVVRQAQEALPPGPEGSAAGVMSRMRRPAAETVMRSLEEAYLRGARDTVDALLRTPSSGNAIAAFMEGTAPPDLVTRLATGQSPFPVLNNLRAVLVGARRVPQGGRVR